MPQAGWLWHVGKVLESLFQHQLLVCIHYLVGVMISLFLIDFLVKMVALKTFSASCFLARLLIVDENRNLNIENRTMWSLRVKVRLRVRLRDQGRGWVRVRVQGSGRVLTAL